MEDILDLEDMVGLKILQFSPTYLKAIQVFSKNRGDNAFNLNVKVTRRHIIDTQLGTRLLLKTGFPYINYIPFDGRK